MMKKILIYGIMFFLAGKLWAEPKPDSIVTYKTIEDVAYSQIKQIKMWEKKHPDYLANEKLLMEWHEMIHNVMGGEEDEDRVKNRGSIKKEIGSTVDMKDDLINL